MDDYIDREELIAKLKSCAFGDYSFIERLFADGVYAVIDTLPAADVVPVVR